MNFRNFIIPFTLMVCPIFAQEQATSAIVGFETLTKAEGFNYLGLRLLPKTVATGAVASVSAAAVTIDADVSDNSLPLLLEVNSGAAAGAVMDVDSVSGAVVTLAEDISSELSAGDTYTIRAAHTLESVFGADNKFNLLSTASFGASDQIWLPDGQGGFEKFAYLIANPFAGTLEGWKDEAGEPVTASNVVINYVDGFILNALEPGELIVEGEVKLTSTAVAITQNFNYIGSIYPAGATLESTFGAQNSAGLTSTASFGASDQVWVPDGQGGFAKFAYLAANPFAGTLEGWSDENGGLVPAADIELPSGVIINKAGDDFNAALTQPAHYDSL